MHCPLSCELFSGRGELAYAFGDRGGMAGVRVEKRMVDWNPERSTVRRSARWRIVVILPVLLALLVIAHRQFMNSKYAIRLGFTQGNFRLVAEAVDYQNDRAVDALSSYARDKNPDRSHPTTSWTPAAWRYRLGFAGFLARK
jgi:hypothetical protein